MKNLFKIFSVAFVLLFGINNVNAQELSQDRDRPEVVAKKITNDLSSELGLNGDQQRTLFRAYTAKETNYRKHVNGKDAKDATVIANKKKFDDNLNVIMKKTLTAEQYQKWLTLKDN